MNRRFLCGNTGWRDFIQQQGAFSTEVTTGYLSIDPERIVSVTVEAINNRDTQSVLVVSSKHSLKCEYLIPSDEARELLVKSCLKPLIIKDRYCIATTPKTFMWVPHRENERQNWNLDIYHEANEGLIINEVELHSEDDELLALPWIGEEITANESYQEIEFVLNPYNKWPSSKLESALHMGSFIVPGR
jgi:CYTH domain-containing protein